MNFLNTFPIVSDWDFCSWNTCYIWIVIGLLIYLLIYIIELIRYRKLSKTAESLPYLSEISIQGNIKDKFNTRHADDLLFSHVSQINELYQRTFQDSGTTLYGEISEIRNVIL